MMNTMIKLVRTLALVAAMSFTTLSAKAAGECAVITATYAGPAGGSITANGITDSINPIVVGAGDTCADYPLEPTALVLVNITSCSYQGPVVRLDIHCIGTGQNSSNTLNMPLGRCTATLYVTALCDANLHWCGVSGCFKGKVYCACQ